MASTQEVISASPDITISLGAGLTTADENVAVDNGLGIVVLEDLGSIPEASDLIGLALASNGDRLFSLDTTTALAGSVVVRPGDVVRYDGSAYSIDFDAAAAGLPPSAQTDAISSGPTGLVLSFDTTVDLGGGLVAADEDLVDWDGANFSLAFDGSAEGLDSTLDVDAGQDLGGGAFLLSFDSHGSIGGVDFADEDVLRFDGSSWTLEFDADSTDPDWVASDLDAIQVPEPDLALGFLTGILGLALSLIRRDARARQRVVRAGLIFCAAHAGVSIGAAPAEASDGILEINQTCAAGNGCFSGDSPGFPVNIRTGSSGKSLRLTSDLVVPGTTTSGIVLDVTAYDVTIDLNGFTVIAAACVGSTSNCTPATFSNQNHGIRQTPVNPNFGFGATVFNGRVIGFAGNGVSLGENAMVKNIEARWNKGHGIAVYNGSIVVDSRVEGNGLNGINVCCEGPEAGGSLIARISARSNTSDGIHTESSAVVIDSVTQQNGGAGIETGLASLIVGNVARDNAGDGITSGYMTLFMRNAAYSNDESGIRVGFGGGSSFVANVARSNSVRGFWLDTLSGYRECVATSNTGGTVFSGINLGANACNGTASCP